jgi:hypothetical protein
MFKRVCILHYNQNEKFETSDNFDDIDSMKSYPLPKILSSSDPEDEIKIRVEEYEGDNLIRSYEYFDPTISVEGSKGNKHQETLWFWEKRDSLPLEFEFKKAMTYCNSICDLRLNQNLIEKEEKSLSMHIGNILNTSQKIHTYVHRGTLHLSECDFFGRNFGRLLYWVDDNPACIYFGLVFKRSKMGHVSYDTGETVSKSILIEKNRLIEDIKRKEENERRKNNKTK